MGINSDGTTLIDQGLFENIGAITWDTTVKTSGFTAVSGNGYFCNTTSAAFTVTLPSSPSAGDVVAIADYANTFDTNNVTIGRNGSNIQGDAVDFKAQIEGLSITLIYVDGTQGWLSIDAAQANDIISPQFVTATGGTITESGDFKIHTFTGPGTFTVTCAGNPLGSSAVDYLAVAGGGGGGATSNGSGGGGAGGFRTSFPSPAGTVPITVQGYPITVGSGGAGFNGNPEVSGNGSSGVNSVFSSFTSSGGGGGGGNPCGGQPGGSGGGAGFGGNDFGTGNTPPVSPPQGNNGGGNGPSEKGSGGGGASAAGGPLDGGDGTANSINGSSVTRAGGGGGGARNYPPVPPGVGAGGAGGGGSGTRGGNGVDGTVNTGGGGGGAGRNVPTGLNNIGGSGGSGIVIIRYKFQ